MTYVFKYRRRFFFRSFVLMGHRWEPDQNKMTLFFPDGSIQEVKEWNKCEMKLGTDWVAFTKKQMELKAGQAIPLTVVT